MTPAETTLVVLTLLTICYFVIGTIWAIAMHRRIHWKTYPKAKWAVFVFNLNMWPECIFIWVCIQIYKFAKVLIYDDPSAITLEQVLANQRSLNKENQGKL